jgi:cytochrome c biogenesis protein
MLVAYRGDLGMDTGTPLSVYTLDSRQLRAGRLKQYGEQQILAPGESWKLDDGSRIEFLGTEPWVSLSVRHDPGEVVVLGGASLLILGLLGSLTGKRRRVFFRVGPQGVSAGGLARSEYPGFSAEFDEIVRAAREEGT